MWPKEWHGKYDAKGPGRPVVRLTLSLYGHPKAGLYWEKHCKKTILAAGFKPVQGWECLYKHPVKKLFLSIYVDDFKMAGLRENLTPMWAELRKGLDIELECPLHSNVYLGCGQEVIAPVESEVEAKRELFRKLFADKPVSEPNLKKVGCRSLRDEHHRLRSRF